MLFLRSTSTDTWETRFLPSDRPEGAFKAVLPREKGHKYSVDHRDGLFYLRTNRDAKNFRLVTAPVSNPSPTNWKELLPHRATVLLKSVELFQDHLVASEKSAALDHFRVLDFQSGQWHDVNFPESVYAASAMDTPEYDSATFRFGYQSMITPTSVYDYDMRTHERTLKKRQEVPGYDPALYATERALGRRARRRQGAVIDRLPQGHEKGWRRTAFPLRLRLVRCGMPAGFNSNRLSLLDRGMVYVIAHIRGGDEMGETWHDDGMLMKKKNTFHDFIDSALWLIANGWTSKDRLVIEGASAGGLLMGAVTANDPTSSRRFTPACRSLT